MLSFAALMLEMRRWFEDKPRLKLYVMADTVMAGGDDGKPKFALTVINAGRMPTTVTHFLAYTAHPWRDRIRIKGKWAEISFIPRGPHQGPGHPVAIGVNEIWTETGFYDESMMEDRKKGVLYVGVLATHRDKPYMIRVNPKQSTDHVGQERSTLVTSAPADPKG